MLIRRFPGINADDETAVDAILAQISPQPIACCNWPKSYPYMPYVAFRAFHTGDTLAVRFDVREERTAAHVSEDNGAVWTDSCVELFIASDNTGYYNFETNCIGTMLLGFRSPGSKPQYADSGVLASVARSGTLPHKPFDEVSGNNVWSMTLRIPPQALFRHKLTTWNGAHLRVNLYKCGDNLSLPHFLSWQPISSQTPNFHLLSRPEIALHKKRECYERRD